MVMSHALVIVMPNTLVKDNIILASQFIYLIFSIINVTIIVKVIVDSIMKVQIIDMVIVIIIFVTMIIVKAIVMIIV